MAQKEPSPVCPITPSLAFDRAHVNIVKYNIRATMINSLIHVCAADLTQFFGKKPQDTAGILQFFLYDLRQIHLRTRRQAINRRILSDL
jgi:hypothetical protein